MVSGSSTGKKMNVIVVLLRCFENIDREHVTYESNSKAWVTGKLRFNVLLN